MISSVNFYVNYITWFGPSQNHFINNNRYCTGILQDYIDQRFMSSINPGIGYINLQIAGLLFFAQANCWIFPVSEILLKSAILIKTQSFPGNINSGQHGVRIYRTASQDYLTILIALHSTDSNAAGILVSNYIWINLELPAAGS